MEPRASARAASLASRLERAAAELIAVIERIDDRQWRQIPGPGTWSPSKDAEHVADAASYHQWIVRLTIGERVASRRPRIERALLTSDRTPAEMVALINERTTDGALLLRGLTDEQLDLPTRPPRARGQRLAEAIESVLVDHYDGHRLEIEAKLRDMGAG